MLLLLLSNNQEDAASSSFVCNGLKEPVAFNVLIAQRRPVDVTKQLLLLHSLYTQSRQLA